MKKIGIIGGAGPFASALLLKNIVRECYLQGCVNEAAFPEIVLLNYPFNRSLCTQLSPNKRPVIYDVLQKCAHRLIEQGAQALVVACNTFHLFVDELTIASAQLVHIAQATLHEAQQKKLSRLLILGTSLTVRNKLYVHDGITCIAPSEDALHAIEKVIDNVLAGHVLKKDAQMLSNLIAQMYQEQPFDGVVLGCTELPVLHEQHPIIVSDNKRVVILDTLSILAKHLVARVRI